MGYGSQQMCDLEATINRVECDAVIVATPIDLGRILKLTKPAARVTYDLDDSGSGTTLEQVLRVALARHADGAQTTRPSVSGLPS